MMSNDIPESTEVEEYDLGALVSIRDTGEIYRVSSGNPQTLVNITDGVGEGIPSEPPSGEYKIVNIYWDDELHQMVFETKTEPEP